MKEWLANMLCWPCGCRKMLIRLEQELEEINMKLSELAAAITEVSEQLAKAQVEIMTKIEELEAALADIELPQDAQDAIAALKEQAQRLDDVVPEVLPTPEPAPEPTPEPPPA